MKYYSSDELARGFLGDECQNQCLTETWSVELKKKSLNFFLALAQEKTQIRHDLPPLLSRILCSSLLFVDDLFSVCFQERLCIFFSRCYSLDVRLFTYAFYCSLSRSSRCVLPILASFLTFLPDFMESLYAVYLLLSLVAQSLYIQPIFT